MADTPISRLPLASPSKQFGSKQFGCQQRSPLAVEALYLPIQTARCIGEESPAGRNAPQIMEETWN